MRLFAAVLPPEGGASELGSVVDELRRLPGADGVRRLPGSDGLRWTGRPGWHFTVAFYGEVAEAVVPDLSERLARAAHRTAPFPLALRGGGHFGGRVLWAGASGDVRTLRLLADRAEAAARKAGIPMEDHRRYRPHLTLARSRSDTDFEAYVTALDAFAGREWTVRELCLVRSELPKSGVPGEQPRYETVARWPLGAGA
ncbi:RNA 2',3'-cyclic phosphodiesterase [Streptomyces sp. NPDC060223]|uniref:RNA 2',3'-cyclic phosphodiesterase n=1 Tax=unclassified Streptomyces TaxID=2593676 RepID=UPI00362B45CB